MFTVKYVCSTATPPPSLPFPAVPSIVMLKLQCFFKQNMTPVQRFKDLANEHSSGVYCYHKNTNLSSISTPHMDQSASLDSFSCSCSLGLLLRHPSCLHRPISTFSSFTLLFPCVSSSSPHCPHCPLPTVHLLQWFLLTVTPLVPISIPVPIPLQRFLRKLLPLPPSQQQLHPPPPQHPLRPHAVVFPWGDAPATSLHASSPA